VNGLTHIDQHERIVCGMVCALNDPLLPLSVPWILRQRGLQRCSVQGIIGTCSKCFPFCWPSSAYTLSSVSHSSYESDADWPVDGSSGTLIAWLHPASTFSSSAEGWRWRAHSESEAVRSVK